MSGKIIAKVRAQQEVASRNRWREWQQKFYTEQFECQMRSIKNNTDALRMQEALANPTPNKVRAWWNFWKTGNA